MSIFSHDCQASKQANRIRISHEIVRETREANSVAASKSDAKCPFARDQTRASQKMKQPRRAGRQGERKRGATTNCRRLGAPNWEPPNSRFPARISGYESRSGNLCQVSENGGARGASSGQMSSDSESTVAPSSLPIDQNEPWRAGSSTSPAPNHEWMSRRGQLMVQNVGQEAAGSEERGDSRASVALQGSGLEPP